MGEAEREGPRDPVRLWGRDATGELRGGHAEGGNDEGGPAEGSCGGEEVGEAEALAAARSRSRSRTLRRERSARERDTVPLCGGGEAERIGI